LDLLWKFIGVANKLDKVAVIFGTWSSVITMFLLMKWKFLKLAWLRDETRKDWK